MSRQFLLRSFVSWTMCRLSILAVLALAVLSGCGSDTDQTAKELQRQNEVEQARKEGARQARYEARIDQLERRERARDRATAHRRRNREKAPTPSTVTVVPPASPPTRVVAAPGSVSFQTGTDAGQAVPAAYCTISSGVYCWTPNDGYTLQLGSGTPTSGQTVPSNRGRAPGGYELMIAGSSRSANGYTCTSEPSGLRCVNSEGHGFSLPRYKGFPTRY